MHVVDMPGVSGWWIGAALVAIVFAAGCRGPALFLFSVPTADGQVTSFVAASSDPEVVAAARAELHRPEHERRLYIQGPLAEGNGGHNTEWNWHFVPGQWHLTDTSLDLCDGDPQFIEDTLRDWIAKIGDYCPKGARLADER